MQPRSLFEIYEEIKTISKMNDNAVSRRILNVIEQEILNSSEASRLSTPTRCSPVFPGPERLMTFDSHYA